MKPKPYRLTSQKYLSESAVKALERTLWSEDTRDTLILLLALKTGARASELLALTVADLNHQDRTLFIRGLKGSNDREVPLSDKLYARVKKRAREVKSGRLFPISYRRLVQIWELYRTEPKRFHSLRHTCAVEMYKRTHNLHGVRVLLGHRSINNTMLYADYLMEKDQLRKLVVVDDEQKDP